MISVEGDFVRTCCTGEGEFGIKRGNIGVLAGFGLFLAGITQKDLEIEQKQFTFQGPFGKNQRATVSIIIIYITKITASTKNIGNNIILTAAQ